MVDTLKYKEWFEIADKDLNGAKILFEYGADYGLVLFHLQQACEKYFKGYLIYQTGSLQGGHNLIKLCKKSCEFDNEFRKYLKDAAFLNGYYIETRYPAEDPLIADKEEVEDGMKFTIDVIELIKEKVN